MNAKISGQTFKNGTCSESQSVSPKILNYCGFSLFFPFCFIIEVYLTSFVNSGAQHNDLICLYISK